MAAYRHSAGIELAIQRLDKGIKEFFDSDHFKYCLRVLSKFHKYSARNCVLIASQMLERGYAEYSGRIAGYRSWEKDFGRHVKRGEKGLFIFAPIKGKTEVETSGQRDEDGDSKKEMKEYMSFRKVVVFAEEQTEGEPLPEPIRRLDFEVDGYELVMEALIQISVCPVFIETFAEDNGINGYFNPMKNEIHIRAGMSQAQTVKTLIHEEIHSILHSAALSDKTRNEKEIEAESGAFIVADYLGIDTSDYSFGYVASWAEGKEFKDMAECIENIKKGSDILITKLDRILCLELTPEEAKNEQTTEEVEQLAKETGADVKGVAVVADQGKITALAAVGSPEDEKTLIQLNDAMPVLDGRSVAFCPVTGEQKNEMDHGYSYGYVDEKDSSWPMVQIRYTNVPGVIKRDMNIFEFCQMLEHLPEDILADLTNYFKVCISYTYRDHKYQRVQDIDLGLGRVNYLQYFWLERNHIRYLELHMKLLRLCDEARHYAPGTREGECYEDAVMEWAGNCREILNHFSDCPVLPNPPSPVNAVCQSGEDIERDKGEDVELW
ncbi:MAG: hypothetical protein IKN79_10780 [Eubacterium sp.]|nr:hypothetical protein [Eubacterium sp.]